MSSSYITSVFSNPTDSHPTSLIAVHHLITIKLTRENYLLWKPQVVPYLRGQHLFKFVDGSHLSPPSVIIAQSSGATTILVNPEFTQWQLQDQIVLSALISSFSKKLFTLRKGGSSIADYFHTFTGLADTLAAIDQPLLEFQLVSFLLVGLGLEYDTFVISIQQRSEPVTLDYLYSHLLNHEICLEQNQPFVDISAAIANFASRGVDAILPVVPDLSASTQQASSDLNWYSDIGATNHLTSDLANLNVHAEEYLGSDQIRIGNSKGLPGPSKDGLYPFTTKPTSSCPLTLLGERASIDR
uniref:Retrotransposon Copia-like N-terminal domain-containing protein n=1 Tax=Fagus sylvatica TaxID=28930 RepID=A0A2N9FGA9_FAGSY